ncbi:type II toxin-antitoxin system prevent-host-death family antitoxin [Siccirubricoccus sp. KC 17139]|uniref:Antitoxin n=1 Tax=Siccirubricoccus soli TaxID=2899147 RepID=A0ABT1DD81_9PROT|nr:type II toxin-antitoxin system prevent-host-death family antitoxin [Siccirubricoccus soli]MCO6419144.1 type II toxin-antitoxin system prevent-host-death family antitoxin [Siccirubricoccus soli]MCP2685279.1 type II toxin-antitoxin system prevent-host-death family antitoxin [Siccirubricoccus soli]
MTETIPATEANRHFSRLLREVEQGKSFTITSHGQPVARIVPATAEAERRRRVREELMARLRAQPAMEPGIGPWTRDELYERD